MKSTRPLALFFSVFSVLARWLKGVRPCQTGLIVNGLARPEMLMEIDVEAVIDAD